MTKILEALLPARDHLGGLELEGKRQTIRRDGVGSARDATMNDEANVVACGPKVQQS